MPEKQLTIFDSMVDLLTDENGKLETKQNELWGRSEKLDAEIRANRKYLETADWHDRKETEDDLRYAEKERTEISAELNKVYDKMKVNKTKMQEYIALQKELVK